MVDSMDDQVAASRQARPQKFRTLRVRALLENVPLALDCVAQWAQEIGIDEHTRYEIQLVVDEACANVVHHAYQDAEQGDMELDCSVNEHILTIRVRDWGQGFEPNCVPEPDVDATLDDRTLGGLGLFFVNQIMDTVQFTLDPQQGNELKMTKRLPLAGTAF
jgi:anti-sigma regulatory factor (Ser/Thr protein kinase)